MLCRKCFWAAPITQGDAKVWCAHKTHHGWYSVRNACPGFRNDGAA
jgi:hypothetical protein